MDKSYKRVNWSNDTSKGTFLNDTNLNVMDKGIDTLDDRIIGLNDRILELEGYEEDARESWENAEVSEANAKTSENNAKTSETNAKAYMEKAFAGTPEGYENLVDKVRLMDIATTTERTLFNSKYGGLKINHIIGATYQNGTPTPDNPIAIQNTGDCVEMIQGWYSGTNGNYEFSYNAVCSKNPIPCKSGDVVKVELETTVSSVYLMHYGESGYITYATNGENAKSYEFTIPSGATSFNIRINNTGITPDTVGKISLTVNDKYVTGVKSHGKNHLEIETFSITINGLTVTVNKDKSVTVKGTATATTTISLRNTYDNLEKLGLEVGESYLLSHNENEVFKECYFYLSSGNYANFPNYAGEMTSNFTPTKADSTYKPCIYVVSGYSCDMTFYPMIRKADITDDTFEPYQESTAYIYTDEPIRDSDVVFNDKGVWTVERNVAEEVFGENKAVYQLNAEYHLYFIETSHSMKPNTDQTIITDVLCTHFPSISYLDMLEQVADYGVCCRANGLGHIVFKNKDCNTADEFIALIQANPITVQYPLATPTYEVLDTASQLALNSLETFDTVTYLEVDSRVQPSEVECEYGTSQVGAYTLKSLLNSESNAIKLTDLTNAVLILNQE